MRWLMGVMTVGLPTLFHVPALILRLDGLGWMGLFRILIQTPKLPVNRSRDQVQLRTAHSFNNRTATLSMKC